MTFADSEGNHSEEIQISDKWLGIFHKYKEQRLFVALTMTSKITDIVVRRDESGKGDEW